MDLLKTRHCCPINNRSGVYRILRDGKRPSVDNPVLEEVSGPISVPRLHGDNEAAIKMTKAQVCNGGPYLVLSSNHNKDGRYFHSNV